MTTQFRRTMDPATSATAVTTNTTPERYRRVKEWAEGQSRRLVLRALADMAYAAVERGVAAVYEELPGSGRINIYPDGRVRITLPWSKHTDEWPLNRGQRELVRALLFDAARQHVRNQAPAPLFYFDEERRTWVVNLADYPHQVDALTWLQWARQAWTPATIDKALQWLVTHAPDGRKRGRKAGGPVGLG